MLQNIVNQKKKAEEEMAQQALDAGKPTKASGMPQPAAPAPVGEKRRNRWDQSAPAECVCRLRLPLPLQHDNMCSRIKWRCCRSLIAPLVSTADLFKLSHLCPLLCCRKKAKVSDWDAVEATPSVSHWDATPGPATDATPGRWDQTPGAGSRWDATPGRAEATPGRRNRWDETPTPGRVRNTNSLTALHCQRCMLYNAHIHAAHCIKFEELSMVCAGGRRRNTRLGSRGDARRQCGWQAAVAVGRDARRGHGWRRHAWAGGDAGRHTGVGRRHPRLWRDACWRPRHGDARCQPAAKGVNLCP